MSELILNPNINDFIYNGNNNVELIYNGSTLWPIIYHVITSGSHGTVTASPNQGRNGTTVTLSNTPDSGYKFSSYTVTGATLSGNQFTINSSDVTVVGNFDKLGLTVDLNNVGEDQTNTFLTQTKYPGVWTGFKVFKTNYNRTGGTFYNYLKNLSNASGNFTFWYYIDGKRNNTGQDYGQVNYSSDGSALVSKVSGWTSSGLDSQNPRWDKSRWRSTTVNISKNGNLNILYWNAGTDMWYTNALYWAVDATLVSEVIKPYV